MAQPSPHHRRRRSREALLLATVLVALAAPAARAQRIFPQQTGWTYTTSSGRGSATTQVARSRSAAFFPEVSVTPGTELLIGPDGNYDYKINDPSFNFGSLYQSRTIEESQTNNTNVITVLSDTGYSVFKN